MGLDESTKQEYKANILYKLHRKAKWGAAHTDIKNLQSGFPGHLKGVIKDLISELISDGLVQTKPTGYGTHVSLNPEKRKEIRALIDEFYPLG